MANKSANSNVEILETVVTIPQALLERREARKDGQSSQSLKQGDQITIPADLKVELFENKRAREGQDPNYYGVTVSVLRGGRTISQPISVNTFDAQVFRVSDDNKPVAIGDDLWLPLSAQTPRFKSLYLTGDLANDEKGQGHFRHESDIVLSLREVDCYSTIYNSWDREKNAVKVRKDLNGNAVVRKVACEA